MRNIFILCLFITFPLIRPAQTGPMLFAPNVINSEGDDYNPTFTPDGQTVFFTRRQDRKGKETIMFSNLENGKWSVPNTAPFSGTFPDKDPFIAPDGQRIFFASTRPNGVNEKPNFDLWYVEKTSTGWSEAKNLGNTVNSPGYDNYPSVAADGTLYFGSKRKSGRGENDLYRSKLVGGVYQTPENLGDFVNTYATEADPFIAPDQSYLIFCSDRDGGEGEGDLYISFNQNGQWTIPQNLGKIINTAQFEYTPTLSPDGGTFYFSRGWGDIFEVDFKALNLPKFKTTAKEKFDPVTVKFEDYVGDYQLSPNVILTVTAENGQLFGRAKERRTAFKMITVDRFTIPEANIYLTFARENGQVIQAFVVENGEVIEARKVKN